MPLPHSINITSGGTGLDVGEMFYGCQRDAVDGPPGSGSRGLSPGEDALSKNFNRSAFALAENDEYLGDIIAKKAFAVAEVGALAAFTGNQISIDPTGGMAGDINFTGTVYMGDLGWPNDQESRDTLFQVLDENYNEVLVDGVEVKVTGFTGGHVVGEGFVAVMFSLGLNKTLPSGDYRIGYSRGTTFEDMPAYAMIRADIRGLHEAPGEAARPSIYVLDPSAAPTRLADFWGPTCLQDALDAIGHGDITLFLRSGAYTVHAHGLVGTELTISYDRVTLVGEGRGGVDLQLRPGHDLNVTGDHLSLQKVKVTGDVGGGAVLNYTDYAPSMIDVDLVDLKLVMDMTGPGNLDAYLCNVKQSGSQSRGAYFHHINSGGIVAIDCTFTSYITGHNALELYNIQATSDFTNCYIVEAGAIPVIADGLSIRDCIWTRFSNCYIGTLGDGVALRYGDGLATHLLVWVDFDNCEFAAYTGVVATGDGTPQNVRMRFGNCKFRSVEAVTRYNGKMCDFSAIEYEGAAGVQPAERGITLDNCTFYDRACKMLDDAGAAAGPAILFRNCRGLGIAVDRTQAVDFRCNGPLIEMHLSEIDTLDVQEDYTNLQAVEFGGTGRIAILEGSTLRNVTVSKLRGLWTYPLFYLRGAYRTTPNLGARAVLDTAVVSILTGQTWYQPGLSDNGLVALLAENARVEHVNVPEDVALSAASSTQALINVEGDHCEVVDNDLRPASGRLLYHIRVRGNENMNVRVMRNTIIWVDAGWARGGTAAIYVTGRGGGYSRHGLIRENFIFYFTDMSRDADLPAQTHKVIYLDLKAVCWIVADNNIITCCQGGAGGEFVIVIQEPAYGTNLVPGGGNNCVGNTIKDIVNLNTPDIGDCNPAGSIPVITAGDPTNTLIRGGV